MKTKKPRTASEKEVFLLVAALMGLLAYGGWTMRASAQAELNTTAQALQETETAIKENQRKLVSLKQIMDLTRNRGIQAIKMEDVVERIPLLQGFTLSKERGAQRTGRGKALYIMWMSEADPTPQEILEMTQFMKQTFGEGQVALIQAKPPLFALSID